MLEQTLSKYFQYDKIFNLVNYDNDMILLFDDLKKLTKRHYNHNYRFIFYHWDTDYYLTNDTPGFNLRNLQRILVKLDIPNYFCLIITQQNIEKDLEKLRLEECVNEPIAISCIQAVLQDATYVDYSNLDPGLNIDKVFISLNGRVRTHRTIIMSLLKHKNLLNKGIVSYGTT